MSRNLTSSQLENTLRELESNQISFLGLLGISTDEINEENFDCFKRKTKSIYHPDKYPENEKELANRLAAKINEWLGTLNSPADLQTYEKKFVSNRAREGHNKIFLDILEKIDWEACFLDTSGEKRSFFHDPYTKKFWGELAVVVENKVDGSVGQICIYSPLLPNDNQDKEFRTSITKTVDLTKQALVSCKISNQETLDACLQFCINPRLSISCPEFSFVGDLLFKKPLAYTMAQVNLWGAKFSGANITIANPSPHIRFDFTNADFRGAKFCNRLH